MISLGQVGAAHDRLLGRRAARLRDLAAVPGAAARRRRDHVRDRRARRPAGAAPLGPLPRADHADVRGRDDHRAVGDRLPERRRRLHGPHGTGALDDRARRRSAGRRGRSGDIAYYRYTVVVCALMFLLALMHVAGKPGRAWASIRESEPAALAAGVNITLYKLWAFALASFVTGVAGCLLAAQVGVSRARSRFQTQDSLTLAATALIGGIFSLWGAVVAGVFSQLAAVPLPGAVGRQPELPAHHLRRRPAAGAADGPGRARASSCRRTWRTSGGWLRAVRASARGRGRDGVIEVEGLTVRFAGVTPIDDMSVVFPGGTCGLIGPNGAGKTTFFNVLSGFVKPATGSIRAFGEDLLRDGRLPARALGAAAHLPDRDGDRAAVGVRQRGDDPRALAARSAPPPAPTC